MNTYWRHVVVGNRVRVLLSKRGRQYRKRATGALLAQGLSARRIKDRLAVEIYARPPSTAVRDLDNYLKAALDAMTHAALIEDDGIIDDLRITRGAVTRGGLLTIEIAQHNPEDCDD